MTLSELQIREPAEDPAKRIAAPENWREMFSLDPHALETATAITVMVEDPRIAPFLGHDGAEGVRRHGGTVRLVAMAAVFLGVVAFGLWLNRETFARVRIRTPAVERRPEAFSQAAPARYTAAVANINANLRSEHHQVVYKGLRELSDRLSEDGKPDTRLLRSWVLTELLVFAAFDTTVEFRDSRAWFTALDVLYETDGAPPPFRAMRAYVHRLHNHGKVEDEGALLTLLQRMRHDYSAFMDSDPELLVIEARRHLAAMPVWRNTEPARSEHWKRLSHAVAVYGKLPDRDEDLYRRLEYERWQRLKACFWPTEGKDARITVNQETYTWREIDRNMDQYRPAR